MTYCKPPTFVLLSLSVITGIISHEWWVGAPSERQLFTAVILLFTALRARVAALGLPVACVLLGSTLISPVDPTTPPSETGRFQAVVQERVSSRRAILKVLAIAHSQERWLPISQRVMAIFPTRPPPSGAQLVLRGTVSTTETPKLLGAPSRLYGHEKWGALFVIHIDEWRRIGHTNETPREAFDGRKNRGGLTAPAFGDKSDVSESVMEVFQRTGTSHLLAVSGLHIGIVAGFCSGLMAMAIRRFKKNWALLPWRALPPILGCGVAHLYVELAGSPVSAERAFIFLCLYGLAYTADRKIDAWEIWGLAALIIALTKPAAVFGPSLQLSFGAVAGILILRPKWQRLLPPDMPKPLVWIATSLGITIGATWGTLPAVAWWFQSMSLTAPLANLLAVPLIGGIATPAAIASVALPPPLSALAASIADQTIDITLQGLLAIPTLTTTPAVGPTGAALLFLCVAASNVSLRLGLAFSLCVICWRAPIPKDFTIQFLNVGQGDAALVEWPDGQRWLIDGGPKQTRLTEYLRRRGIRRVDTVILSHPHADHKAGLTDVLTELDVGEVWVPPIGQTHEASYRHWILKAQPSKLVTHNESNSKTEAWSLDQGIRQDDLNNRSLVVNVRYGRSNFLFCGDIEAEAEHRLSPLLPKADVIKVPHHGSRTSSTPALLEAVQPKWAVFSAGLNNRFGHPHPEVWARYHRSKRLLTATDGDVIFRSDGWTVKRAR